MNVAPSAFISTRYFCFCSTCNCNQHHESFSRWRFENFEYLNEVRRVRHSIIVHVLMMLRCSVVSLIDDDDDADDDNVNHDVNNDDDVQENDSRNKWRKPKTDLWMYNVMCARYCIYFWYRDNKLLFNIQLLFLVMYVTLNSCQNYKIYLYSQRNVNTYDERLHNNNTLDLCTYAYAYDDNITTHKTKCMYIYKCLNESNHTCQCRSDPNDPNANITH